MWDRHVWETSRLFAMWIAQNLCETRLVLISNLEQSYKVWVLQSKEKSSEFWKSSYGSPNHTLKLPTDHSDVWNDFFLQFHHTFLHCQTVFLPGHFSGERRTVLPWKQNTEVKVHLTLYRLGTGMSPLGNCCSFPTKWLQKAITVISLL